MMDDRAARGKDGSMIHCFHNLDVFGMRDAGAVIRARANQRSSPNSVHAAVITVTVSAGDAIGVLPKPK